MLRLARVATGLLDVHVEIAKREASRDRKRLAGAAASIAIGTAMLLMVVLLLEGAAVIATHDRARLDWPLAFLAVAGANAVLGSIVLYVASRRFKAPVMPETRSLVRKTFAALTQ